MAYLKIHSKWLPYAQMSDPRGFISRRFGDDHSGVDSVGNAYGNPVCAILDGRVTNVYTSTTLGHVVEYGQGPVRIAHYHLAKVSVKVGQAVTAGRDILGTEGDTGSLATGKHLHTSLWIDDVLTDPEPYLSGEKKLDLSQKGEMDMTYQTGDRVSVIGRIYSSAWGAAPSIPGGGGTYQITDVITMNGVTKPYQLGKTGFCGDSDIGAGSAAEELKNENEQLRRQLTAANAKLDAVRKAIES